MGRSKSTHDREALTWLSSICASVMGDPRSRRGFGCDPTVRRRSSISVRSTSPRSGCRGGSGVAEASSTSSSPTSSTALPAASAPTQTPARRAESVDVTQFFSDATRELLQRAAQTALEWGSLDLESDHLLYGAPPGRRRPPRPRAGRRRPRRDCSAARGGGGESRAHGRRALARPGCQGCSARRLRGVPRARCLLRRARARATRPRSRRGVAGGAAAAAVRHLAHEAPWRRHSRRRRPAHRESNRTRHGSTSSAATSPRRLARASSTP